MATLLSSPTPFTLYLLSPPRTVPSLRRCSSRTQLALGHNTISFYGSRNLTLRSPAEALSGHSVTLGRELRLAASAVLFLGLGFFFGARTSSAASFQFPPSLAAESSTVQEEEQTCQGINHELPEFKLIILAFLISGV